MNIQVNYLAVFLASVASMVIGFLWYSPVLLGKPWMREMGLTAQMLKKAQKEMGKLYGVSFIVALITAYVLSYVMSLMLIVNHGGRVSSGLTTAFWMWLGFVMPVQVTDQIFGAKKWRLLGINTGYQLVALLVMGLVLAMF